MKRIKKQSGFGVIGITVLIVVIIVIATGVFFVNSQLNKTNPKSSTPASTTKPSSNDTTVTTPPSTTQATNTYSITEINAEMTLPTGLTSTDLKYSISTSTGVPIAYFSTASLEHATGSGCSPAEGPIGAIWRTQSSEKGAAASKQIGQYYYNFAQPQAPCTGDENASNLEVSQATLLQQAFETITTIN